MALPDVKVSLSNGAIGALMTNLDGVSGLVMSGVATGLTGLTLGQAKAIYSLKDAESLGITATSANAAAYRHIKEFYAGFNELTGLEVAELWIMLYADTITLANMADQTHASSAKKLLDAAGGRIRLLGLTRTPGVGYTATTTSGLDADSFTAVTNAQTLGNTMATGQAPVRILVEGRAFVYTSSNVSALTDLGTMNSNRVSVVLGSSKNDGSASVGYALGRKAGAPVQRNLGRVKSGKCAAIAQAYIGDTAVESITSPAAIHDKRYIIFRKFPNKDGYFFNDDPTATNPSTDDYNSLGAGCVVDKAHRIAYATYLEELNDDVNTIEGGKLEPGVIATLQRRIEEEVGNNMAGEISSFRCFIDPDQNVVTNNKVNVQLRIRRKGYLKEINISLGFEL